MRWVWLVVVLAACAGESPATTSQESASSIGMACSSLAATMCQRYLACGLIADEPACESTYYKGCCASEGICNFAPPLFGEAKDAQDAADRWDGCPP